jgi:hypothetical protein
MAAKRLSKIDRCLAVAAVFDMGTKGVEAIRLHEMASRSGSEWVVSESEP